MRARTTRRSKGFCALFLAGLLGAWGGPAAAEVLDRVVAVVDEEAIFLSDVERRARPFLAEANAQGGTPAVLARRRQEVLREALDRMIDDKLLQRAATRAHQAVNDTDVDEFVQRIAQERNATPEQVYQAVQSQGITRMEYRSFMESELLRLRMLQLRVRGRINITDADLRAEYHRLAREQSGVQVTHAAHVFIAVPEDATAAQLVQLRQRAEDVARRARAGEPFGDLARQFSDDEATRGDGGDLGDLSPGTLPDALEAALLQMAPGDVSEPVRGDAGFHVLRLVGRDAAPVPPFEQVRERVYGILLNREMLRQQGIYLRELRRGVALDMRL
ncbi:MAG: peptidylprolyl isomerase [Deltaproteobacteria bacterium]|nr:peptidylprolyl isomerase [Deltaproteobacteria bacterium]